MYRIYFKVKWHWGSAGGGAPCSISAFGRAVIRFGVNRILEWTGYSHGLCPTHSRLAFADVFRRQQAKEGNPDCYLRCFGNCQRHWCTFYPLCTVDDPGPEHLAELQSRLEARLHSFHVGR